MDLLSSLYSGGLPSPLLKLEQSLLLMSFFSFLPYLVCDVLSYLIFVRSTIVEYFMCSLK